MIHTKPEQSHFTGFILDIEPNAIKRPNGRDIKRVTKKILSVSQNPARRSKDIDKKEALSKKFCIINKSRLKRKAFFKAFRFSFIKLFSAFYKGARHHIVDYSHFAFSRHYFEESVRLRVYLNKPAA